MILLKNLKSIYKLLLISILATFTVASSASSIELEGKYLYLQGGMALNDITLSHNGNSNVDQDLGNGFAIGIGEENAVSEKFGLGLNVGYEVDFSPGYKGASGEGADEPCLSSWAQGACSVEFENVLNVKFLISGDTEITGLQPYVIAGLSSANIKATVDSGAIQFAGQNTTLTDERRLGYIVGFGLDKEIDDVTSVRLNYTLTSYGDQDQVGINKAVNYATSSDYRLELLSIGIKKKF
jgi:opacity protein-like surface antigen